MQVNDPVTGVNGVQISGIYAGNPSLRAETSKSAPIGAVFEPSRDFTVGLTWCDIEWKDQVGSYGFQALVKGNGVINGVTRGAVNRDPITHNMITVATNFANPSTFVPRPRCVNSSQT